MPLLTISLALSLACTPPPSPPDSTGTGADPQPEDTDPPSPIADAPAPDTLASPTPAQAGGFGAALAFTPDGVLWIGAPHGTDAGVLYRIPLADTVASEMLRGPGRLGSVLAPAPDGSLAVVAPLLGTASAADGSPLPAATPEAGAALVVWADDAWQLLPARVPPLTAAAAAPAGGLAVGSALTSTVWRDEVASATQWTASGRQEEAGAALAVGDFDADGALEWAVGAPGAERVYLLSLDTLQAEGELTLLSVDGGRFGAALAAVPDLDGDGAEELLVGAPLQGALGEGAAHLYRSGHLTDGPLWSWIGETPRGLLGFSVAATAGQLALGEPGAEQVQRITPLPDRSNTAAQAR